MNTPNDDIDASRAIHTGDYNPGYPAEFVDGDGFAWFNIGHCAVDSAMLMLTDPCYVATFVSDEAAHELKDAYPYSYDGACAAATWDDYDQLGGNRAVVLRTAGDGFYDLAGRFNGDGDLVEVRLRLRS